MDFFEFLKIIDSEAKRIGWTIDGLKHYVMQKYGKKSRYLLSDEQLWELYRYLHSLPDKPVKTTKIGIPKIGLNKWKKQTRN